MTRAILTFVAPNKRHTFLSNFYPSPLVSWTEDLEEIEYPTVEHYYQAQKNPDVDFQRRVAAAPTPGEAKRLGRASELREGWEGMKYDTMKIGVAAKFSPETELAEWLLETGEAYLVEGNTWGDKTWGQVNGEGENWLGIILMAHRTYLRYLGGDK